MKNTSNVLKGLEEIPTNYELVNELIEQRNKKKVIIIRYQNQGIYLACKDHLLSYFVMNGFSDSGIFEATYGDGAHIEMIWVNPYFKE